MRSKLTLSEVKIKKNTSGGDTAGIYIFGSELILGDCRFEEQTSVEGAFINAQTSSSIYDTGSEFYQGVASNIGGTIRAIDTQIIMNKSNFTENSADQGGAIWAQNGGPIALNNCFFSGNTASNRGGAVDLQNINLYTFGTVFSEYTTGAISGDQLPYTFIELTIWSDGTSFGEGGAFY